MLHSWWGNGVFVDPRDGNWCEGLTSYATNYYGHVLDDNETEARRKRRNYSHYFSRLKPEDDKPLGTFGLPDGCNRQIAYDKGAMVFHMLARGMGQDRFWTAMRRFGHEFMARPASWEDIRHVCEQEHGQSLETFFSQWVRRPSAPMVGLESARYDAATQQFTAGILQDQPPFELDVPVRAMHANGSSEVHFHVTDVSQTPSVELDAIPMTAALDPDFHLLRRLLSDDIVPTTAATRRGPGLAVVLPSGQTDEAYAQIRSIFESSYKPEKRIVRTAGDIEEGALAERCVLILGAAVRDAYVGGFLTAIKYPVTWHEQGFEFDGTVYTDDADGVLCTAAHPGVPGGGVTIVYGNASAGVPRAMNVPMYEHSLVIFQNGRPVVRHDFERRKIVPVTQGG
jgi:hypothetical protein